MKIKIEYDGRPNDELDCRLAGLLEFPPFNYEWCGQGYDFKKHKRDLEFELVKCIHCGKRINKKLRKSQKACASCVLEVIKSG